MSMFGAYLGEFIGTAIMILLGSGVVANLNLEKSGMKMKDAGPIQISIAWGFAVVIPAYIFGNISGAHFNSALTIALAIDGSFEWAKVPGYIIFQFAGAFVGACWVYLLFKDHFDATESSTTKLGVFATSPSIPNKARNILSEAIGTFVLVFAIKGISQVTDIPAGVDKFLLFGIIVVLGMSFGGLTGYAINPARDLAPRFAHYILPIQGKGSSNWGYAPVVIVGPLLGAVIAVLLYKYIPW